MYLWNIPTTLFSKYFIEEKSVISSYDYIDFKIFHWKKKCRPITKSLYQKTIVHACMFIQNDIHTSTAYKCYTIVLKGFILITCVVSQNTHRQKSHKKKEKKNTSNKKKQRKTIMFPKYFWGIQLNINTCKKVHEYLVWI